MIALYVYYKTPVAQDAAVREAVARLAALVAQAGHAPFGTWRRPEARDGLRTWMEVHAPVPAREVDALEALLARSAAQAGLEALLVGARHVERFEPA